MLSERRDYSGTIPRGTKAAESDRRDPTPLACAPNRRLDVFRPIEHLRVMSHLFLTPLGSACPFPKFDSPLHGPLPLGRRRLRHRGSMLLAAFCFVRPGGEPAATALAGGERRRLRVTMGRSIEPLAKSSPFPCYTGHRGLLPTTLQPVGLGDRTWAAAGGDGGGGGSGDGGMHGPLIGRRCAS